MFHTLYESFEQVSGRFIPVISYSAKHFNVTIKNMYCSFIVLHVPVLHVQKMGGVPCTHFQTSQFVKNTLLCIIFSVPFLMFEYVVKYDFRI